MQNELDRRLEFAVRIAREAGEIGLRHFRALDELSIESKGHQDLVSNADRELELFVRAAIREAYPDDAIVGEEHGDVGGTSGQTWVIDPIDGTANFVRGIPAWCVAIACTDEHGTNLGVVCEPSSNETFYARRGGGAFVDGRPIRAAAAGSLAEGAVGTGFSNRREMRKIVGFIEDLFDDGGIFYRNASGALMLAYVAAGRLLGYVEEHMNSWDCLAGLLMVEEAGGRILAPDPATMVAEGTKVVAGGPGVYARIEALAAKAFD